MTGGSYLTLGQHRQDDRGELLTMDINNGQSSQRHSDALVQFASHQEHGFLQHLVTRFQIILDGHETAPDNATYLRILC